MYIFFTYMYVKIIYIYVIKLSIKGSYARKHVICRFGSLKSIMEEDRDERTEYRSQALFTRKENRIEKSR